MNGLVPAMLALAVMALGSGASIWYFKRIRKKDRADPVINPRDDTGLLDDPTDEPHGDSGDAP